MSKSVKILIKTDERSGTFYDIFVDLNEFIPHGKRQAEIVDIRTTVKNIVMPLTSKKFGRHDEL